MTPMDRVIEILRSMGCKPKQCGKGWKALCPAHDDRNPSLSIGEGRDGKVLLKCHAGCNIEVIVKKLGLKMNDLFGTSVGNNGAPARRASKSKHSDQTFWTAEDAIKQLETTYGPADGRWDYTNASGATVLVVLRWDKSDGDKMYRPVSCHGRVWRIKGLPPPRPLYKLLELAEAKRVVVVEGEKCAEVARKLGFVATTSAGGAQAADQTDWGPLAGREVWILPDNDAPGRKYAERVANILARLTPTPVIRIVELPGLRDGGDIEDWANAHGDAAEPDTMRAELESLAQDTPPYKSPANCDANEDAWPEIVRFDEGELPRFPIHVLPEPIRAWVERESHATQTPPDLPGLLALAVCSACIAGRVVVEPRPGWREPTNLFVAIILDPGNRKSAVFRDATAVLSEIERELVAAASDEVAGLEEERRLLELRLRKLEKQAERGDCQAKDQAIQTAKLLASLPEPVRPRLLVDDVTEEKLGMMLAEQNGRLASMSPEGGPFDHMAGLYSKNGIAQFTTYLKAHSGDNLVIDRVTRKSVYVTSPALVCAYTVQPIVLEELSKKPVFRGRGLLARFLYAAPQSWIGKRLIAPEPVPESLQNEYRNIVRTLYADFSHIDAQPEPVVLKLTEDAVRLFRDWEAEIEGLLAEGGRLEGIRDWGGKLAGATLRLAGVLHCLEYRNSPHITARSVEAAIEIARYLILHAVAVLQRVFNRQAANDARYLLRWIKEGGHGEFTKRDAYNHNRHRFPASEDVEPALRELEERGYIRRKPTATGGRGRPCSPVYVVNPAVFQHEQSAQKSQKSQNSSEEASEGISATSATFAPGKGQHCAEASGAPDDGWGEV